MKLRKSIFMRSTIVLMFASVAIFIMGYLAASKFYCLSMNSADFDYLESVAQKAIENGKQYRASSDVIINWVDDNSVEVRYTNKRYKEGVLAGSSEHGLVVLRKEYKNFSAPVFAGCFIVFLFWSFILGGAMLGIQHETYRKIMARTAN